MDNTSRRGTSGVFMALTGLIALMMLIVIIYGVASSNPDLVKHIIGADSASDDSGDMYSDDMYYDSGYYDENGNYIESPDGDIGDGEVKGSDTDDTVYDEGTVSGIGEGEVGETVIGGEDADSGAEAAVG